MKFVKNIIKAKPSASEMAGVGGFEVKQFFPVKLIYDFYRRECLIIFYLLKKVENYNDFFFTVIKY